jgi:hypothetical protein
MSSRIPTGTDYYNGHNEPLTPMDLVTVSQSGKPKLAPRHEPNAPTRQITGVQFIAAANQRDSTMRIKPCKDSTEKIFRRFRPKMKNPCTLATGLARNQPMGLQSLREYPTNIPIMAHPDTFYPNLNTTIPAPA